MERSIRTKRVEHDMSATIGQILMERYSFCPAMSKAEVEMKYTVKEIRK